MFQGFTDETFEFFLGIKLNNNREWFEAHRGDYERFVRGPMLALIESVNPVLREMDPELDTRPNRVLSRIRRDTRFSKDKSPYRDHLWLLFRRGGEVRETSAMYWFELAPDRVEWGLGFWDNNRPAMDALRKRIREKPDEVSGAFAKARVPEPGLDLYGDRYQRMAIPPGLPQILQEVYPLKELYIKRTGVPLKAAYSSEVVERCSEDLLRLKPLYALFRKAADEGMAALEG